jgi:hypothetical protein
MLIDTFCFNQQSKRERVENLIRQNPEKKKVCSDKKKYPSQKITGIVSKKRKDTPKTQFQNVFLICYLIIFLI